MIMNILFEIIAFASLAVFNVIALKKIPVSPALKNQKNGRMAESLLISAVQYIPMIILSVLFGLIVKGHMNYFALLVVAPFVLLWFFGRLKVDGVKYIDMITPAYPLALMFSKLGCFFAECCNGIEADYGFYNSITKVKEAPVQLIEAFYGLLIFLFFICYRKFAKKGSAYPIYVILYNATRFFSEFLRAEKDVLWIFKTYHILCLLGIVIGVAELILVSRNRDKLSKNKKKKA